MYKTCTEFGLSCRFPSPRSHVPVLDDVPSCDSVVIFNLLQGSPAYQGLQQSLYEECQRRLQRDGQIDNLKRQMGSIKKQAACWEKAAESGAAKIAQLQDDVDKERRY